MDHSHSFQNIMFCFPWSCFVSTTWAHQYHGFVSCSGQSEYQQTIVAWNISVLHSKYLKQHGTLSKTYVWMVTQLQESLNLRFLKGSRFLSFLIHSGGKFKSCITCHLSPHSNTNRRRQMFGKSHQKSRHIPKSHTAFTLLCWLRHDG